MCRFIDNFMDIQSNAVTTDESIVLKLAEDVYFLVIPFSPKNQGNLFNHYFVRKSVCSLNKRGNYYQEKDVFS